jgi:hypothetical protein
MEYLQCRKWTLYAMSHLTMFNLKHYCNVIGMSFHCHILQCYISTIISILTATMAAMFNVFWQTFMTFSMFLATFLLFLRTFTMLHYILKIHLLTIADFWMRFYLAIDIEFNVDLQKNYKYHLRIFSAHEWPKYRSVHENENKDIFLLEMYKRLSCKPIIRYVRRLPSKRNNQTVASSIIKPKTTSRSKNKISKNGKNACHDHPIKSTF